MCIIDERATLTSGGPTLNQYDGLGGADRSLIFSLADRTREDVFAPSLRVTPMGSRQLIIAPLSRTGKLNTPFSCNANTFYYSGVHLLNVKIQNVNTNLNIVFYLAHASSFRYY